MVPIPAGVVHQTCRDVGGQMEGDEYDPYRYNCHTYTSRVRNVIDERMGAGDQIWSQLCRPRQDGDARPPALPHAGLAPGTCFVVDPSGRYSPGFDDDNHR